MTVTDVHIIDVDDDWEAIAVRSALEYWGAHVSLHLVGKAKDLVDLLGGKERLDQHVLLMCHGGEAGIMLPELEASLARQQPYQQVLTPANVAEFVQLPGSTLVCTGCATGSAAFARAFLAHGATHYIAPHGFPEGSASLFFLLTFFYHLLARHCSVPEAYRKAQAVDEETHMFTLFA